MSAGTVHRHPLFTSILRTFALSIGPIFVFLLIADWLSVLPVDGARIQESPWVVVRRIFISPILDSLFIAFLAGVASGARRYKQALTIALCALVIGAINAKLAGWPQAAIAGWTYAVAARAYVSWRPLGFWRALWAAAIPMGMQAAVVIALR